MTYLSNLDPRTLYGLSDEQLHDLAVKEKLMIPYNADGVDYDALLIDLEVRLNELRYEDSLHLNR